MEIIRGTTPNLFCVLPSNLSVANIKEIWLSVSQNGVPIVDKRLSRGDLPIQEQTITSKLTQEETLMFVTSSKARCGVRILLNDSTALASKEIFEIGIVDVVKGGVIT